MARPRNSVPSYRLRKQSGQGMVTLTDQAGNRRDVLLGPYNSPESLAEYHRVVAEWQTTDSLQLECRVGAASRAAPEAPPIKSLIPGAPGPARLAGPTLTGRCREA